MSEQNAAGIQPGTTDQKPSLKEIMDKAQGKTPAAPTPPIPPAAAKVDPPPAANPPAKTPEQEQAEKKAADDKAAADKIIADKAAADAAAGTPPADDEDIDEATEYYQQLNTLFGEGDAITEEVLNKLLEGEEHALAPSAIHKVTKYLEQRAIERFQKGLVDTDRRAEAYRLHRQAGGKDEDFFNLKIDTLPALDQLQSSVDLQRSFYKSILVNRGISDDDAQMIVDKTQKDGKLLDIVSIEHKKRDDADQAEFKRLEKENKDAELERQTLISNYNAALNKAVFQGEGLSIQIPDSDRAPFAEFVKQNTWINDDGSFYLKQDISDKNFAQQMEAAYFAYAKGDLSKIIKKQAATAHTKKLRLSLSKDKAQGAAAGGSAAASPTSTSGNKPMRELFKHKS
jgi:hypothetical protein